MLMQIDIHGKIDENKSSYKTISVYKKRTQNR